MAQPRYIAYYRVSTAAQGRSGLGLEAQQAAVKAFLQGRDHTLASQFIEVESGRNSERPRLGEALSLARKLKATLVIAKLDRLARSVSFIANLMDAGVEFVACDMPAANRLTLHIMAAVGEAEARMISERTVAALAAAKARGVRLGNPTNLQDAQAAGHKTMVKDADLHAAKVLATIREIVRNGTISSHKIARQLEERSVPTRRGGSWSGTSILNTIRRCGFESVAALAGSGSP
ncbi:MAG: recombinase family protein [Candidatus Methylumidiphilus sp.]